MSTLRQSQYPEWERSSVILPKLLINEPPFSGGWPDSFIYPLFKQLAPFFCATVDVLKCVHLTGSKQVLQRVKGLHVNEFRRHKQKNNGGMHKYSCAEAGSQDKMSSSPSNFWDIVSLSLILPRLAGQQTSGNLLSLPTIPHLPSGPEVSCWSFLYKT